MARVRLIAAVAAAALLPVAVPLSAAALAGSSGPAAAATTAGSATAAIEPPAEVRAMLSAVDSRQIERYDQALVSFHNRNTLSAQDKPNEGRTTSTDSSSSSQPRRADG